MTIISNNEFSCYETTEESWGNGKEITLDGERLVSAKIIDTLKSEILKATWDAYYMPVNKLSADEIFEIIDSVTGGKEDA